MNRHSVGRRSLGANLHAEYECYECSHSPRSALVAEARTTLEAAPTSPVWSLPTVWWPGPVSLEPEIAYVGMLVCYLPLRDAFKLGLSLW